MPKVPSWTGGLQLGRDARLLIRWALNPAPKPLSMLTTETPLAQEFIQRAGWLPAEIGPIAHAGRYGYHRGLYQACQHAGESSFHARHGHQCSSLADRVQMGNQAVQAGHAAVPVPDYPAAQKFRRQGGLLRYVLVRGPRADDADEARRSRNGIRSPMRMRWASGCMSAVGKARFR